MNDIDWTHDQYAQQQYEDLANELYQNNDYIPPGVKAQLTQADIDNQKNNDETFEEYEEEHDIKLTPLPDNKPNVGVKVPIQINDDINITQNTGLIPHTVDNDSEDECVCSDEESYYY